jgi:hypothetical protein
MSKGQWFSPASSTTKTGRHDIAEILLKVALNTKPVYGVYISHLIRHSRACVSYRDIGTSRTVGSAKKFVRITSGFGGGEFTKTLRKVRKVCTCQKFKFSFLLLEYCKIREIPIRQK